MPIASGAAGRRDVGGDPGGQRTKTKPANRNCDSYLQRYQELQERKRDKSNMMQVTEDHTEPCEGEGAGQSPQKESGSEDHAPEERRSKTSQLCVLL